MDGVCLDIQYYIINDLNFEFDILVVSNFTENTNIVYYRIDDSLYFKNKPNLSINQQNIKLGQLTKYEKEKLLSILDKYEKCFYQSLKNLGSTHSVSLSIELTSNKPVFYRPY